MAADPVTSRSTGFAVLAKRISSWTTKGLLSVMILVAGLGFGRQVLRWWAEDTGSHGASSVGLPAESLGDPSLPHLLEWGDQEWSLERQSIVGDKTKAIDQLRSACRGILANTKARPSVAPNGATTSCGFLDGRDDKFLAILAKSKPVAEEPGRWRLYEFNETLPMAVAVVPTEFVVTASAGRDGGKAEPQPAKAGITNGRIAIWALAVPTGDQNWTLWLFQPESRTIDGAAAIDIPLPPGCRRMLSLRVRGGGSIIAFVGAEQPDQWKRFYRDWSTHMGWMQTTPWQAVGNAWCAKFAASDGSRSLDVRLGPDARGGWSGLLMLARAESK